MGGSAGAFCFSKYLPNATISPGVSLVTMSAIAVLLRLPDLKFSSCLAIYSQCWPARRGNTSLEDSPSAPWQTKHTPETIFLARASSACCAHTLAVTAMVKAVTHLQPAFIFPPCNESFRRACQPRCCAPMPWRSVLPVHWLRWIRHQSRPRSAWFSSRRHSGER